MEQVDNEVKIPQDDHSSITSTLRDAKTLLTRIKGALVKQETDEVIPQLLDPITEMYKQSLELKDGSKALKFLVIDKRLIVLQKVSSPEEHVVPPPNKCVAPARKKDVSAPQKTDKFLCDVCCKICKSHSTLKNHLLLHKEERPYKCQQCERTYVNASALNTHVTRAHCEVPLFACHFCDKRFRQANGRNVHERVHRNERPYECTFCHRTFIRKHHLKQHVSLHTDTRPYRCEVCYKAFVQLTSLKLHRRKYEH